MKGSPPTSSPLILSGGGGWRVLWTRTLSPPPSPALTRGWELISRDRALHWAAAFRATGPVPTTIAWPASTSVYTVLYMPYTGLEETACVNNKKLQISANVKLKS